MPDPGRAAGGRSEAAGGRATGEPGRAGRRPHVRRDPIDVRTPIGPKTSPVVDFGPAGSACLRRPVPGSADHRQGGYHVRKGAVTREQNRRLRHRSRRLLSRADESGDRPGAPRLRGSGRAPGADHHDGRLFELSAQGRDPPLTGRPRGRVRGRARRGCAADVSVLLRPIDARGGGNARLPPERRACGQPQGAVPGASGPPAPHPGRGLSGGVPARRGLGSAAPVLRALERPRLRLPRRRDRWLRWSRGRRGRAVRPAAAGGGRR